MKKRDLERLAEIALRANAGDEAKAGKLARRLWRLRRWTSEQTWRAEAKGDTAKRQLLERVSSSVDAALEALAGLQALEDVGPAAAPEAATAVAQPAAAAVPEMVQEDAPNAADLRVAETTAEKVDLVTSVLKSGAKA